MPRRLIVALAVAACLAFVGWRWSISWRLARGLELLDREPTRGHAILHGLGASAILPIAMSVAQDFDVRPLPVGALRRLLVLEQLVRTHVPAGLELSRDPRSSPEVRVMLATFLAGHLDDEERWELARHWAERDSPWVLEPVSWLSRAPCPDLLARVSATDRAARRAAATVLAYAPPCPGASEAVVDVAATTSSEDLRRRALHYVLADPQGITAEIGARVAFVLARAEGALAAETMWHLRVHPVPGRTEIVWQAAGAASGDRKRDVQALLLDVLAAEDVDASKPPWAERLAGWLTAADPALRALAAAALYPDRPMPAAASEEAASGLAPATIADTGLVFRLGIEQRRAVVLALAADGSAAGRERFRRVVLGLVPPLDAATMVDVLAAAAPDNRDAAGVALLRLSSGERAAGAAALVALLVTRPELFDRQLIFVLGERECIAALTPEARVFLDQRLLESIDLARPENFAVWVDVERRRGAARLAMALASPTARRVLLALAEVAEDDEAAAYLEQARHLADE